MCFLGHIVYKWNRQFRVLRCVQMEVLSWEFKGTPPMPYQRTIKHDDPLIVPQEGLISCGGGIGGGNILRF